MIKLVVTILFALVSINADEQYYINNKSDKVYYEYVQMLLFGDLDERVYAADNLRFIRSKRAVRPLMEVMKGKPEYPNAPENSPYLKFTVAQALAALRQEIAIKPIIDEYNIIEKIIDPNSLLNFANPTDYKMEMAAGEMLRSIAVLGYTPESETVINNALNHKHYYVRSSAADAMSILKRKESIAKLTAALATEKNDYTRTSILTAIVSIEKSIDDNFRQLTAMLKNEDPNVRYRASQGLGTVDLKAAELELRKALLIEEVAKVRDQLKKDLAIITSFDVPTPTSSKMGF